eukprot:m.54305 g.54305  ORF g.54305 m.54305 type:complete len:88 (+) comp15507_c0_seq1:2459-2722(+)
MLSQVGQPHGYLVQSMRERDATVRDLTEQLEAARTGMQRLQEEKNELLRVRNVMSADLERLIVREMRSTFVCRVHGHVGEGQCITSP